MFWRFLFIIPYRAARNKDNEYGFSADPQALAEAYSSWLLQNKNQDWKCQQFFSNYSSIIISIDKLKRVSPFGISSLNIKDAFDGRLQRSLLNSDAQIE